MRVVLYLVVWVLALSALGCGPSTPQPRARRGVLDARGWDFEHGVPLKLDGEWALYWLQDLSPAEARTRAPTMYGAPHKWPEHHGYVTARLRVLLPDDVEMLTAHFAIMFTAAEVFLDGRSVLRNGRVATRPEDAEVLLRPMFLEFVPRGRELEIVVRASNWDFIRGGLYNLNLGDSRAMRRAQLESFVATAFLLGTITIMAIYHLGLFILRRKERGALYFAALCLLVATFNFMAGNGLIYEIFPELSGELWWKVFHITWLLACPAVGYFIHTLFPDEYDARLLRPQLLGCAAVCTYVALVPIRYYGGLAPLMQLYTLLVIGYTLHVVVRALGRGRDGAKLLLSGITFLSATVINDILAAEGIVATPMLSSLGLFALILALSMVWASRNARTYAALEASQRSRTALFHNTSHELRTPLNGILGFIKLLRRGHFGDLTPSVSEPLLKIQQLANGLLTHVNTILDLARSQHGRFDVQLAPVRVLDLVREAKNLADGLALREADLHFKLEVPWQDAEGPSVLTDRNKLLAILRNLIGNAFKFRRPGAPHTVTLRMRHERGMLHVEVSDTGIGIAKEDQARIFEEFAQVESSANRAYEGTGLGLALVKRLVEGLRGTAWVDSTLGKGSTFFVQLPAPESEPALAETSAEVLIVRESAVGEGERPSQELALPSAPHHDHVLVVDDNPTNLELVNEVLTGSGYRVKTADGGVAALAAMAEQKPDLLLLDVMMPEVSGEDVLRAMREDPRLCDVPVLLLTARASDDDRLLGLKLGADDYLAKPVDPAELVLRVHNTLARALLSREKSQHEANLAAAQAVQQTLLPSRRAFPGMALVDHYRAAELTGGDWFSYAYDEQRERLFVAVGDATGHGVPAALVTGTAAGAFKASCFGLNERRTLSSPDGALLEIAQALNHALLDTGSENARSMTMALLAIDLATGEVAYLNAGHQPLFHVRGGHANARLRSGAPLGVERHPAYTCECFALAPGDTLFLFTDGLLENEGPEGRTLSARRVKRLLVESAELSELKERLLAAADAVWSKKAPDDDCTFVLMRFLGASVERPSSLRLSSSRPPPAQHGAG